MKTFRISFILSVLLIAGGFFCPPMGEIDGSVITAVGLLLMFEVVEMIPQAIREGRNIKLQTGDSSVEITSKEAS